MPSVARMRESRRRRLARSAASSPLTVTLSKNSSTGRAAAPAPPWRRRNPRASWPAAACGRGPRSWLRPGAELLRQAQQARHRAARHSRGRPSSPRCAGYCRRAWRRSGDWRRPRFRGSSPAHRPGPAGARNRPRPAVVALEGEDRGDEIVADALLPERDLQPVGEELQQIAAHRSASASRAGVRCSRARPVSTAAWRVQRRPFSRMRRMTPSAARRSAKGSLRAGGLFIRRPRSRPAYRSCRPAPPPRRRRALGQRSLGPSGA